MIHCNDGVVFFWGECPLNFQDRAIAVQMRSAVAVCRGKFTVLPADALKAKKETDSNGIVRRRVEGKRA